MSTDHKEKVLRHGSFIGGPIGFLFALIAAGTLVKGVSAIGILLGCFTLFAFVWRSWEFDSQAETLTLGHTFFGIPLNRKHYRFEEIDRIVVEPAGEGFIRFGNIHGQMVTAVCGNNRVNLAQIHSSTDLKAFLRSLRKMLPRNVRIERKKIYVFGRD
jgi:hypothetical protein